MLKAFLRQAEQDLPVYISDVRTAFQTGGTRPFHLQVTLYDGSVRRFPIAAPAGSAGAGAFGRTRSVFPLCRVYQCAGNFGAGGLPAL